MKYRARSAISLLLAAFLLAGFAACSGGTPDLPAPSGTAPVSAGTAATDVPEPSETADPASLPDLPADLDFGGAVFTLAADDIHASGLTDKPEMSGELMNDARYDMLAETMEALNVSVREEVQTYSKFPAFVRSLIQSGDGTYDAVNMLDRNSLDCARCGCYLPLQTVPYLDLTKDYWSGELSDALSVNGVNYYAVGSFQLYVYANLSGVVFNNAVAENNHVEIPYDDVDAGTWTMDKLEAYRGIGTADMDGDGENDRWTYGSDVRSLQMTALVASGFRIVDKDKDGTLFLNLYENTNTFVDIMYRIQDIFYEGDMRDDPHNITVRFFMDDQEMIHIMRFVFFDALRDMESDFSILPMPKWDEAQKEYHSRTFDSGFVSVPLTAKDTALSGAVLELLSSCGYRYVVPAYIENQLGSRLARDPRTSKNIKLIYDTRMIDLGEAYFFERYGDTAMYDMIQKSNIASYLASSKVPAQNALNKIVADLASLK